MSTGFTLMQTTDGTAVVLRDGVPLYSGIVHQPVVWSTHVERDNVAMWADAFAYLTDAQKAAVVEALIAESDTSLAVAANGDVIEQVTPDAPAVQPPATRLKPIHAGIPTSLLLIALATFVFHRLGVLGL